MAQNSENPCNIDGVAHQHVLTLRRVLDATPEQIWKAWMTPELLQQWFAPRPWTISAHTAMRSGTMPWRAAAHPANGCASRGVPGYGAWASR